MFEEHRVFLTRAIGLAASARQKGNHPFGALLVQDGDIVHEAENSVVTDRDKTRHAELNLIQTAREAGIDELHRTTLYTSTEPCAMCAAAIYWAGIRHVVYALPTEALAELACGSFVVPCRDLYSHTTDTMTVEGPFMMDEARTVHLGFW